MTDETNEGARRIGPYQLYDRLGVGGMGEVWMAEREGPGGASKRLALKLLHRDHLGDPKRREMFLSEARLAMLLNHSNIVQVFDVGEIEAGEVYMAMEWVEGLDLAALEELLWARGEGLSPTLSAYVVGEVLKALICAHEFVLDGEDRAIIHRDVTPHNVMLSVWGEVKLMDFGVARMASARTSGVHAKGKLRYMPPEQLIGDARTASIDLFAVGGILHELLDRRGFREEVVDEARLFGMVIRGEVDPLRDPEAVPAPLDGLRRSLLDAEVERRVQSAREAQAMLRAWSGYRDAKLELEELVRRLCHEPERTHLRRRIGDGLAHDSRTITQRPSETLARLRATNQLRSPTAESKPTRAHTRGRPRSRPRSFRRGRVLVGALALSLGCILGVLGLGRRVAPAPASIEAEVPSVAVNREHPIVPWREPTADLDPRAAVATSEATPTPDGSTAQRRRGRAAAGVTLRAPNYSYIELRVGGRRLTLDKLDSSRATLRLSPGTHVVEYRVDGETSWRTAGRLALAPGRSVQVTLTEAGTIEVQP